MTRVVLFVFTITLSTNLNYIVDVNMLTCDVCDSKKMMTSIDSPVFEYIVLEVRMLTSVAVKYW